LLSVWRWVPPVEQELRKPGSGLRALAGVRDFWFLLLGFAFLGMLAQSGVLSWMPTYLRSVYGWTAVNAGIAAGVVAAGLMIFPAPFGIMADRLKNRRAVMLVGCGLGVAGWLLLVAATDPLVSVLAALLVSASMAATIPMQAVYASERFLVVGSATAVALINTGGQIAQSLAVPLYGAMLDRGLGFGAVWSSMVVLGVLRIGVVLLLDEPKPAPSAPLTPARPA
jgi:MFS family permease